MLITIKSEWILSRAGFTMDDEENPGPDSITANHSLWIDWLFTKDFNYSKTKRKFQRFLNRKFGFKFKVANIDTSWQEREKTGIWWDGD